MSLEDKINRALSENERAYYQAEAARLSTDWFHETLMDEASRRGFRAVSTSRDPFLLRRNGLPLSDEELVVSLCRPTAVKEGRSLILAFQVIARGQIQWARLVELARENGVTSVLKWLATRSVTPRTAALLFHLRGEEVASINIHADRFRKPYLRPLPV